MEPITAAVLASTATAIIYFFIDRVAEKYRAHQRAKQEAADKLWHIKRTAERAEAEAINANLSIAFIETKLKELKNEK